MKVVLEGTPEEIAQWIKAIAVTQSPIPYIPVSPTPEPYPWRSPFICTTTSSGTNTTPSSNVPKEE